MNDKLPKSEIPPPPPPKGKGEIQYSVNWENPSEETKDAVRAMIRVASENFKSMRYLNEVTLEEAKEIIGAGYPLIISGAKWRIDDRSEVLGEPCQLLKSSRKILMFWFMNDSIGPAFVDPDRDANGFDETHYFDCHLQCYVKAVELGFHVPALQSLTNK